MFYDASDELEDFQEIDPIVIQLRDGRQIEVQEETKEMFAEQRKRRQARSKSNKTMAKFRNKTHYLIRVKAAGRTKDKLTGCYLANTIDTQSNNKKKNKTKNHKKI